MRKRCQADKSVTSPKDMSQIAKQRAKCYAMIPKLYIMLRSALVLAHSSAPNCIHAASSYLLGLRMCADKPPTFPQESLVPEDCAGSKFAGRVSLMV